MKVIFTHENTRSRIPLHKNPLVKNHTSWNQPFFTWILQLSVIFSFQLKKAVPAMFDLIHIFFWQINKATY